MFWHVRRRRERFETDASLIFHLLVQNDRADPRQVRARRARAAEKSAAQAGRGQFCATNLHGDNDQSEPAATGVCGLPARGGAAFFEISRIVPACEAQNGTHT
jgi:hypothetical protein